MMDMMDKEKIMNEIEIICEERSSVTREVGGKGDANFLAPRHEC